MENQSASEQPGCDKLARVLFRTGFASFAAGILYGMVLNGPNLWVRLLS